MANHVTHRAGLGQPWETWTALKVGRVPKVLTHPRAAD